MANSDSTRSEQHPRYLDICFEIKLGGLLSFKLDVEDFVKSKCGFRLSIILFVFVFKQKKSFVYDGMNLVFS